MHHWIMGAPVQLSLPVFCFLDKRSRVHLCVADSKVFSIAVPLVLIDGAHHCLQVLLVRLCMDRNSFLTTI